MRKYRIDTNYRNPKDDSFVWETQAKTYGRAISNIRARVHYQLGVAWMSIDTYYWKEVS